VGGEEARGEVGVEMKEGGTGGKNGWLRRELSKEGREIQRGRQSSGEGGTECGQGEQEKVKKWVTGKPNFILQECPFRGKKGEDL